MIKQKMNIQIHRMSMQWRGTISGFFPFRLNVHIDFRSNVLSIRSNVSLAVLHACTCRKVIWQTVKTFLMKCIVCKDNKQQHIFMIEMNHYSEISTCVPYTKWTISYLFYVVSTHRSFGIFIRMESL